MPDFGFDPAPRLLNSRSIEAGLRRAFDHARAYLESVSPLSIIRSVVRDRQQADELAASILEIQHVGFIVPGIATYEALRTTAIEAGFARSHACFPSTIVARELGAPTMIFKAHREVSNGGSIAIEAFVPDVPQDTVYDWVSRNVGAHIAMRLKNAADLPDATQILERAGCTKPSFMNGLPMTNVAEGVTVEYVDLPFRAGVSRLELFYQSKIRPGSPND
jgi:hypothetical protein